MEEALRRKWPLRYYLFIMINTIDGFYKMQGVILLDIVFFYFPLNDK